MKKDWISYKELSEKLGLPVQTLRIWKMQGRLHGKKFGSRILFHNSYVAELEANGVPAK